MSALAVKVYVPAIVGVPVMLPLESGVSPGGKVPLYDHVTVLLDGALVSSEAV